MTLGCGKLNLKLTTIGQGIAAKADVGLLGMQKLLPSKSRHQSGEMQFLHFYTMKENIPTVHLTGS